MKIKKQLALFLAFIMLLSILPVHVFAAADKPSNASTNLVVGILNDDRADGIGEFPNEPSVTGYDYYYLQSNLSLSTSYWSANFSSNADRYIDIDAFWDDPRVHENADGDAFGYYCPTGLDLSSDAFFVDGIEDAINEETIITNWLRAKGMTSANPDDYKLLFYVLKYETGWSSGYHLDAKVVAVNNVTLSYSANTPAGVNTDVTLPSSSSVPAGTQLRVSDISTKTLVSGGIIYTFTGWNTEADGNGTPYENGDDITVNDDIVLYAQWESANTYTITWLNYNDEVLHTDRGVERGVKIGNPETYYDGTSPSRPSTSHSSYSFSHWELVEGSYDSSAGITEDLTYKAVYEETTITYTATVKVVINTTFDNNGEPNDATYIDISTVESSADNVIYLKNTDGSGGYIALERDSKGVYTNSDVSNGDYYIYIRTDDDYIQVGTQELTIASGDRTRYLEYYSVEYFDGVDSVAILTEYYYTGSTVNVTKAIPEIDNYTFKCWEDEDGTEYASSTSLQTVKLTDAITKAYKLTAQWVGAKQIKVIVVADHNGRTSEVGEDLTVHLTSKNAATGNYNEVSGTSKIFSVDEWYEGNTTAGVTTYDAGYIYTNLSPDYIYGAHASIPGYRSNTDMPGGEYIVIDEDEVTIYLIYDPNGYELTFRVDIDPDTPERMIPEAVDVKVTRYNAHTDKWEVIDQHAHESVEVVINKTRDESGETVNYGEGTAHVWGFAGNDHTDPYLYRIDVVRIDLGDYQLTAEETVASVSYQSKESGFFPSGAYTADVEVFDSDLTGGAGGLQGAHANSSLEYHGSIVATVSVHPYTVKLDPNGGQWASGDRDVETVYNRFTVPTLSSYIPEKDGETFIGWYLDDFATQVETGKYISDYVSTPAGTLTLYAMYKPDITVKGTVIVDLGEYPCDDDTRTVSVAVQKLTDGNYIETSFVKSVTLEPVAPDNDYAIGSYEFTNVPDTANYRVSVFVHGGGSIAYQNEPDSRDENKLYSLSDYSKDNYTVELDGDLVGIVNIYMEADTFELGYMADTSAIAADFRPSDIKLDLRHDHRPAGAAVTYATIKDDIVIDDSLFDQNGISDIATLDVPPYHANGYLYDYVISVLNYDLDDTLMGADANGWNDRHYYHYETTPGYFPAPFSIHYDGPANFSENVNADGLNQNITLKAIFVPNTYTITYDLNNGTWASQTELGPTEHTWSFDTELKNPVRPGYVFMGWTADVSETYDAENNKVPANVWQDVKLTANWEADTWKDDDSGDKINEGDGVPDKYQALLVYMIEGGTWDGTDSEAKWNVITLKEKNASGEWTDITPEPKLGDYTPDITGAQPDSSHTTPAYWSPIPYDNELVKAGYTVYTYKFIGDQTLYFTFDANEGSWNTPVPGYTMSAENDSATISVSFGAAVSKIATEPTRDGYEFVGWYSKNTQDELTAKWWAVDSLTYNIYENDTVYAKWEAIPVTPPTVSKSANLYVNLQDESGSCLGGTDTPISVTDTYKVSSDNDASYVIPATIVKGSDKYIYEGPVDYSADLAGTVQNDGNNIFVILQYTKDNWGGDGEQVIGDDIPDKYQVMITYESENVERGTVDKDVEIFTLPSNATEGDILVTANAAPNGSQTHFVAWLLDDTKVSNKAALNYLLRGAQGGKCYEFIAKFGVTSDGDDVIIKKYILSYETNTGEEIPDESYLFGKRVVLTKVPEKEGFVFDGWYLDKKLTEKVSEVKMTKDITVYAGWVKDKSTHETPDSLNGEEHFAYVIGYPDNTVRPDANITRAEVTAIFFRLLKADVRDAMLSKSNAFEDVDSDAWYNTAVSTMAKFGIVEGRSEDKFVPDAYITRAEFAAICARFDDSEFEIVDDFPDVAGHWAEDEIHEAAAHGWIKGYEDDTFRPDRYITRAEAMTLINRMLNRVPETEDDLLDDMIKWSDNNDKSAWYYLPIQEATNSHEYEMKDSIYERWTAIKDVEDWEKYE